MPLVLSAADVDRWRSYVVVTASHAIWMGAVGSDGYGRFSVSDTASGRERIVTPHQVAAVLAFGQIPAGATVLHDCDVRICCCTDPGHVRIGTQAENVAQAVARGRLAGPRPGLVDVRGPAGCSRAIQQALGAALAEERDGLAAVVAAAVAAGDPRAGLYPLFDLAGVG